MLYHINYKNQQILFIHTGPTGAFGGEGIMIHYVEQNEEPVKKFIEVNDCQGNSDMLIGLVLMECLYTYQF